MEQQMRVTYANAAKLPARFGATLDNVVEETLYVLDVDAAFAVAGNVRKEAYGTAAHRNHLQGYTPGSRSEAAVMNPRFGVMKS
jgi:enamine deaminase RidA (YjgF/YER057c/UK114 family)